MPRLISSRLCYPVLLILVTSPARAQDWATSAQACVARKDFSCADQVVRHQLQLHPTDPQAIAWKARLLAWRGQWDEAIATYNAALRLAPADSDTLLGLADVQTWKREYSLALLTLDRAAAAHAAPADILPRQAAALAGLGRTREAEYAYEDALRMNPADAVSRQRLRDLRSQVAIRRHEFRAGSDSDAFSFANPANAETLTLRSDWNRKWTTRFSAIMYQRFGQTAESGSGEITFRLNSRNWLTGSVGFANHQEIVPEYDNTVEFGHSFSLHLGPVRGIESYVHQRNYWYETAQVSAFGSTQVLYLPKDCTWTLNVTAARTELLSGAAEWSPAGFSRFNFPFSRLLQGSLLYGVGTEDFLVADEIGRFSAHTYGGGVRIRLSPVQDLSFQFAFQNRSRAQSQTSAGVSYGMRF